MSQAEKQNSTTGDEHLPCPEESARHLRAMDIMPLPLPWGKKQPTIRDWRNWECPDDKLAQYFPDSVNVGVILGEHSGNLADVDLDTLESIITARFFLPPTGMVFGRQSKPASHYVYRLPSLDGARELKFIDPSITPDRRARGQAAMLCELRWSGQTVFPYSLNTAGSSPEIVRYEPGKNGSPSQVGFPILKMVLGYTAASALLARLWQEGSRHHLALPVAGFLFYGGMAEDQALLLMRAICTAAHESEPDTDNRLAAVRDTYKNGLAGLHITGGTTLEDTVGTPVVNKLRQWLDLHKQPADARIFGVDNLPLAHDGDGDRFILRWSDRVIYCMAERRWYIWDGVRWVADRCGEVREMAKEVAVEFRGRVAETLKLNPTVFGSGGIGTLKENVDWGKQMGNGGHIDAMLQAASTRQQVRVLPEQLDANPLYFNVRNTTLELDVLTGKVGQHRQRPEDYITMLAPIDYLPGKTEALIDEYRGRFFPEDPRFRFLLEMGAEAITGLPKRHSLNLIGPTNAGKSMTLSLFGKMFGDYASTLEYTSLMRNRYKGGDSPRADLWRIRRKRLVTISEVPPDIVLDVALYKALLGGDRMAVRTLYDVQGGEDVQWAVSLWMSGNKAYGPPPDEAAAYERLLPLLCEHQVAPEDRDMQKMLQTLDPDVTGSALLNLILEAFTRVYSRPNHAIEAPDVVLTFRTELQNTLDPWSETIEALFEFTGDEDDGVLKAEAFDIAKQHRMNAEDLFRLPHHRQEQQRFEEAMKRRGAIPTRRETHWQNRHYWQGVRWSANAWRLFSKLTPPDWD